MYIRNIEQGLRGVNTPQGTVYLAPGEGRDVELVAAEEAAARATGWFVFSAERAASEKVRKRRKVAPAT